MLHPSYTDLMRVVNKDVEVGEEPVVNSRYSIVIATAKRARQIIDGADPLVRISDDKKAFSIAVEELYEGKVKILSEDPEELDYERLEDDEYLDGYDDYEENEYDEEEVGKE